MITFSKTIEDIKADCKRRMQLEEKPINVWSFVCVFFNPGMLNVLFYRLSRYCFHHRIPVICKLATVFSQVMNSTEIAPQADIGPGLYIENSGGVGGGAMVTGGIVIGDHVKISMNAVVESSFEDHAVLFGVPARNVNKKVADD